MALKKNRLSEDSKRLLDHIKAHGPQNLVQLRPVTGELESDLVKRLRNLRTGGWLEIVEGAPELRALADLPVTGPEIGSAARGGLAPALPLATAIGRIAARRADLPQPRPAPLYLRGADAAPPSDPPPMILD